MNKRKFNEHIKSNPVRRQQIAYHEAGHLIAYGLYHQQLDETPDVRLCSIVPSDSVSFGFVMAMPIITFELAKRQLQIRAFGAPEIHELARVLRGRRIPKIECQIKCSLAGLAAECLLALQHQEGQFRPKEYKSLIEENASNVEVIQAARFIALLDGEEENFDECRLECYDCKIEEYIKQAESDLMLQFKKVIIVADELLEYGELDQNRIESLYKQFGFI